MTDGEPKRCFVIAPIGAADSPTRHRSDKVLRHIIAPVVEARGYEAVRADQIAEPGLITSQVIQRIIEDPLVVADLSEWNPNVFYELALRHALRRPLIQLIGEGERIPFDVAGMRTVTFDVTDLDSVEAAKREIDNQLAILERDPDSVETPISFTLDVRALRQGDSPEGRSIAELVQAMAELKNDVRQMAKRFEVSMMRSEEAYARARAIEVQQRDTVSFVWRLTNEMATELSTLASATLNQDEEQIQSWMTRLQDTLAKIRTALEKARY
jgi:hypothetical protein